MKPHVRGPKDILIETVIHLQVLIQKLELKTVFSKSLLGFLHFMSRYTWIEDPENLEERRSLFDPWPGQRGVAAAFFRHRRLIILKARQLGLTWLCLAYALWKMLCNPGFKVVALSKRELDAKELVRRIEFILRNLPPWMMRERKALPKNWAHWDGHTWESTILSITIRHPNPNVVGNVQRGKPRPEDSSFVSMSAAPDSGRSFTADLVILDEWAFQAWAREIYSAAYPTINRPRSGQIIGLSTAKRGTLFDDIWKGAISGKNLFHPIFLPWWTDPRRNEEWYEDTKANLPLTYKAEYPSSEDEAFSVGEGAFFPYWSPEAHIIKEAGWYPPKYCQLYGAYDAGFGSRACFKWYAVFPGGKVVCYREYYPHQVIDRVQAQSILSMSKDPYGEQEILLRILADPSSWNKQSSIGESTAEIFAREGLYMEPANNDLANGWRRLQQWLYVVNDNEFGDSPSLMFTLAAANSIRTYPSCMQSKNNPEDIDRGSEHHCYDDKTEVLTANGWKLFRDITLEDKLASLTENHRLEYLKPVRKIERKHKGEMYLCEGILNFCVTPDHIMVLVSQYNYKRTTKKKWHFATIEKGEFTGKRLGANVRKGMASVEWVPRSAIWEEGKAVKHITMPPPAGRERNSIVKSVEAKALMRYLGFWLAEGCASKNVMHIDQKELETLIDIAEPLGFSYSTYKHAESDVWRLSITSFQLWAWFKSNGLIGKTSRNKRIPRWVLELDTSLLQELYEGLMAGDGHINAERGGSHYTTASKGLADDVQELLLKLGKVGTVAKYKNVPGSRSRRGKSTVGGDIYRVFVWKRYLPFTQIKYDDIQTIDYDGMVYCVTLPRNNTVYVRRNGRPMWCGQCQDTDRYLVMAMPTPFQLSDTFVPGVSRYAGGLRTVDFDTEMGYEDDEDEEDMDVIDGSFFS